MENENLFMNICLHMPFEINENDGRGDRRITEGHTGIYTIHYTTIMPSVGARILPNKNVRPTTVIKMKKGGKGGLKCCKIY